MDKTVKLNDEEINLLITGLRCMDEVEYNSFTLSPKPFSEIKSCKEELRIKLKRILLCLD